MRISVFEIFKIGIGPSSSHTVGPMRAARDFAVSIRQSTLQSRAVRVTAELFGSLALTGRGHGTDRAILLGLSGEIPEEIDPASIEPKLRHIRDTGLLPFLAPQVVIREETDIIFHQDQTLTGHSNGMRFTAFDDQEAALLSSIYYSVGGGFIEREGESNHETCRLPAPHPFGSASELISTAQRKNLSIWELVEQNEQTWRPQAELREAITKIHQTMEGCIDRGLATEGILPGGLKVQRRASGLFKKLTAGKTPDLLLPMDYVNAFAMAVNEENAAGGRIVTAPTNGAAGVIPAVLRYYRTFIPGASSDGVYRFLLSAGAIGILYKENASISGAEVGCQGEVGVACSMAAAGLVAALGGTNLQIEYAAEIGMEHHLGMTCDPIGGLVQIPCIERNAMGAVKAINACRIAMRENGGHKVSLDQVIETMYRTGLDMQSRYKETSLAGLALNVIEC